MNYYEGRIAIITGAGRGIGRAIAEKILYQGGMVVAIDLAFEEELLGDVIHYRADVSREEELVSINVDLRSRGLLADMLFTCAGVKGGNMSEEEVIRINFGGTMNCVNYLNILNSNANIVIFSSDLIRSDGTTPYIISKKMIAEYAFALIQDDNVTENIIPLLPGPVDTELFKEGKFKGEKPDKIVEQIRERFGIYAPEDFASALLEGIELGEVVKNSFNVMYEKGGISQLEIRELSQYLKFR